MVVSRLKSISLSLPSLFLLAFHLSASQNVPEYSEAEHQQCVRKEHPTIAFEDLKPWVSNFTYPGVQDFSQLALDANRNQLIVGARNYLFRLSLHNVSLIQATAWGSDEDTRRSCQSKGKTEEECQNYVRVLIVYGKKVFTCGTNAFSPVCSSRQVGNLSKIIDRINGVARCPYDPRHNSTAVITSRGELYAATVIDFSGRDPAIYRSLGNVPPLRTAQYNSKWLNEPNFIAAYDIGLFTYFFFRENAVEHDCGKTVYSRVARVCKNDIGGRFLLEDTWTTFMKARLNCSRSGEIPFYYNELQSTFYLPEQDLIYGVFTTNVNSIAASAVCAFNLSAITQAFNGPFRYQENPRSAWLPTLNPIPNFQCGTLSDDSPNENLTERVLQDAQRLFLMNDVVQPVTVDPYVTQDSIRFSKLVVDIVQGKDTLYHVMYIGTEYGTILKALSTTNRSLRSCYLEEMQILPDGQREAIKSLQILHSDRSLFVGLNNGVLKIPLERCSMYRTEGECLGARDPYCGWDNKQKRCTTIEDSSNMSLWTQNITECPVKNLTTNGRLGPWSPWQLCEHSDGDSTGSCMCRSRSCDSPRPRCGGHGCEGARIEVANCSRNGAWTPWSSWAPCSTSCGIGFQVRQRTCSNPAPRYGGRVCVGQSREERNIRPATQRAAQRCAGTHPGPLGCLSTSPRMVPARSSASATRVAPSSPIPTSCSSGGRRLRVGSAPMMAQQSVILTLLLMTSSRLVRPLHGLSMGAGPFGGPGLPVPGTVNWALGSGREHAQTLNLKMVACLVWGQRWSTKTAILIPAQLPFPAQPAGMKGSWSCWTPWSHCSATCGGGHYQRTRTCTNPAPSSGEDICIGLHTEEALCNTHPCEGGWSEWSEWSLCNEEGVQYRSRYCEVHSPDSSQCVGNSTQYQDCLYNEIPVILPASSIDENTNCGGFSLIHLIATGVSCFFGSSLLTFVIYVYCQRCQRQSQESTVIHPTTPNHLHYKGNTTPKNEKYTPMEFKTLNKNNLIPDDRTNFYPLQQTNVYTTTYYPSTLNKYDYRPEASPGRTFTNS
ncbi:semaphorin-5B isoform X4 [Apus apus]|uniref:semaphorin-5B isoform X4 n=1 Tax=Apus apus TaxID=8895 RepID=UPI0021F8A872|nr:semaphorin-5B isoform X4 [Apus apus]